MTIKLYSPEMMAEWNRFVSESKNGTFLFDRRYMDYHSDRFDDYSLVCYNDKGQLIALLPANRVGTTLYSHQGLTYGGLILNSSATLGKTIEIFEHIQTFLYTSGIRRVIYKPVPRVYHQLPSDEDIYSIFNICGARLSERKLSSVIDLTHKLPLRQNRRTALNKAHATGVEVYETDELSAFWPILEENLRSNHDAKPVHTLEEMTRLYQDNRGCIHLLLGKVDDQVLGGILLYEMPTTIHTQYISATEEGKRLGVVDAIMEHIMQTSEKHYLDIGTSAGENGELLNMSLMFQKEGFGGRGVCYDTYEWDVK